MAEVRRRRRLGQGRQRASIIRASPSPRRARPSRRQAANQTIYFHKLGTPQSADRLVYATPGIPDYGHGATISEDGRWLVITTSVGTDDRYEVTLIDLTRPNAKPRTLVKGFTNNYRYVGNAATTFYFVTNDGAPKLKLVAIDVAQASPTPRDDHRRGRRRRSTACRWSAGG